MEIDAGFKLENSYAKLPKVFYSKQNPEKVPNPKLVILNKSLCAELNLDINILESPDGINAMCGNKLLKKSIPIAQAYAGHQFGYFTMLGDGRAILLGEHVVSNDKRYDIQLKGSGITPYSRGGDGKATLSAMLREYIISEGINYLKIPTTRSLAVIETGEEVYRKEINKGAVLVRVASSHIRVGTFQYISKWGSFDDLKSLADYTINRHYPSIYDSKDKYRLLLREVINNIAILVSKWQLVGFIHGVMNTDNMAISGETIDYGPCAFMDVYNRDTVFSSIDLEGRYAYKNQPIMAKWNLARFSESLLPLLSDNKDEAVNIANEELEKFYELFHNYYLSGMKAKLGIFNDEDDDKILINSLLEIMEDNKADYTNTFYSLTSNDSKYNDLIGNKDFEKWERSWKDRLSRQEEDINDSIKLMKANNPVVIPRNSLVEEALEKAAFKNDYLLMEELLDALRSTYDYSKDISEVMRVPKSNACYKTYCGT